MKLLELRLDTAKQKKLFSKPVAQRLVELLWC